MADLNDQQSASTVKITGSDSSGTETYYVDVDSNGNVKTTVSGISGTVSLPTGAATSALQTTGNTSLSNIDGKLSALNTTATGTLTAATQTCCLLDVGDYSVITIRPSGSWSGLVACQASADGVNFQLNPIVEYGTRSSQLYISTNDNIMAQIGGFKQVRLYAVSMTGTANFSVSLGRGGNFVNVVQATPAALYATVNIRDGNNSAFIKGQTTMAGSLPVTIASNQSAVPASQSGTWDINNISGTVSLPTGASTAALQTTGNTSLSNIDGKLNSLGQKSMANSMPVVLANDYVTQFAPGTQAVFGSLITANRNNQIECDFSSGNIESKISKIVTGTGSATISGGQATFSTGAGTTSSVSIKSFNNLKYTPGKEMYAEFTAMFTTPTSANSHQRVGLYDDNNGFFFGYNGTTFGFTRRNNGVDTFTAKSSFSNDTLTGAASSLFTRSSTPEAIDLTKLNLYRIRFGWLGGATIIFEVMNPDGTWVIAHKVLYPNANITVSVQTPELPLQCEVIKASADATDLIVKSGCWGAGSADTKQLPLSPSGSVRTTTWGASLFRDHFDGNDLDFEKNWILPITSGSGSYTVSDSIVTLTTGTTASNAIRFSSAIDIYTSPIVPQQLQFSVKLETTLVSGNHRFWGIGIAPTNPTALAPLTDAIGFEIDTNGSLNAVIYAGGTKTFSKVLNYISDGLYHSYMITYNDTFTSWLVDSEEIALATATHIVPNDSEFPIYISSINGASPLASAPTFLIHSIQGLSKSNDEINTNSLDSGQVLSGFLPDPTTYNLHDTTHNLLLDSSKQLVTRSTVLTDEGSYRDDFSGSLFTTLTGTIQTVNNNFKIVGSGTTFSTEVQSGSYIKKVSDSEVNYSRVSEVESDTILNLESGYTGTTATGSTYGISNWKTFTNGGSISLSNSILSLSSGTGNGAITAIERDGDYLPYNLLFYASISQRVANQQTRLGFVDDHTNISKQACFLFDGTDNTIVKCVSAFSSATGDSQTTSVSIPLNGTTASYHTYEVDVTAIAATFSIDGRVVARHTQHLPGPYDPLQIAIMMSNSAVVTATTLSCDYIYFADLDRLQIANDFQGEPLKASMMGISSVTGLPVDLNLDSDGNLIVSPLGGVGADFSFGDIAASGTSPVGLRRTTYTAQTTNGQRSFASSSANDTLAGTGAQKVRITYFDQNGLGPYTETVDLNGTSRVNTVATNICFIESMEVTQVGSNDSNVGIITLYTVPTTGGSAIGTIGAGDNQTFWCHHYVAANKTCRIAGISGATDLTSSSYVLIYLKSKPTGATGAVDIQISDSIKLYGGSSETTRNYNSPITVEGPARILLYAKPGSNSAQNIFGSFDFTES